MTDIPDELVARACDAYFAELLPNIPYWAEANQAVRNRYSAAMRAAIAEHNRWMAEQAEHRREALQALTDIAQETGNYD